MPWLQLTVRAIEQGFVGIIRIGRRGSDFIIDTVRDGCFVHTMFLVLLAVVNGRHIGHGGADGAVKAGGGHGAVEVSQTEADVQEGE